MSAPSFPERTPAPGYTSVNRPGFGGDLTACLGPAARSGINAMAVARYQDRRSVACRKSDHGDALVLANILDTDLHAQRPLPADSEPARAAAVLARGPAGRRLGARRRACKLRGAARLTHPAKGEARI
jgi:hypothetical protein